MRQLRQRGSRTADLPYATFRISEKKSNTKFNFKQIMEHGSKPPWGNHNVESPSAAAGDIFVRRHFCALEDDERAVGEERRGLDVVVRTAAAVVPAHSSHRVSAT